MRSKLRICSAFMVMASAGLQGLAATPQSAQKDFSWALHYDPKTLDPAKVDDQASDLVRYLTGGVLIRLNRNNLQLEPELAESWTTSPDGKLLTLRLRPDLQFSDGSPLTSADVVSTLQRVLAAATEAPAAEEFLQPSKVAVEAVDRLTVRLHLPVRVVQATAILDEIAIEPANRPSEGRVTAGPFTVAEYRRGDHLRLQRNEHYWKHDAQGRSLPYLSSVRLDILANADTDQLRFLRHQYALLESVSPEAFSAIQARRPGLAHDLGPSLNTEQMWFNQSPKSPLPAYESKWFTSRAFRAAISQALHRDDLVRIAYDGHATAANGFISPANYGWYNRALPAVHADSAAALSLLATEGFQQRGGQLFDHEGHPVKFSLLTNAGNKQRERMAALIQQDLAAIGVQVNVVTLDFPALIDRLMHTGDYEAALLGLSNVQPDPSTMMNVWLSNSPNHQWNPSESTPATAWEAEIDRTMRLQAETSDPRVRKAAVDRVQAIVAEQLPFIYLVYPNTLCAVSPEVEGGHFSVLQPSVVSSLETMRFKGQP